MNRLPKYLFISLVLIHILCSCTSQQRNEDGSYLLQLPPTFDSLPPIPENNKLTAARIELGEKLFFEKRLSSDGTVSCGSCHKPSLAYADTLAVSGGVHGRFDNRNSPSLINVAWQKHLFREGGVPSLEIQALAPFANENEMDFSLTHAAILLSEDDAYRRMAMEAYDTTMSAYVMGLALACFQRSLISTGSRYDAWLKGDTLALSAAALRGLNIFNSERAACAGCHSGFLLTNQEYHNIGLYTDYNDEGRGRLTRKNADLGKMKTPSLRNVGITAPYMHDGSLRTLTDVIQFFNEGGNPHQNKDERIKPLKLNEQELKDLEAFLMSLTDISYADPLK